MKVKIEFEIDAAPSKIVDMWLEKVTLPIRMNRFLIPGSWKLETEDA